MHCINEYVNYSGQGVCKIEDIRCMDFSPDHHPRTYYILKPVYQQNAQIFVPVDSQALSARMRPVLSPKEIDSAILSVKNQYMPWISDRKERAARFQEILSRRDERELLLLISCLYLRGKGSAKGLPTGDAQVLKQAETVIDQEFSFSLQISTQNIGEYIRGKLGLPSQQATSGGDLRAT